MNYCSNKLYLELNIFNHFTVVGHWTSIVKFGQLYQQVEVFIKTLVAETCLISPELLGPEGKPVKDGRPKISL